MPRFIRVIWDRARHIGSRDDNTQDIPQTRVFEYPHTASLGNVERQLAQQGINLDISPDIDRNQTLDEARSRFFDTNSGVWVFHATAQEGTVMFNVAIRKALQENTAIGSASVAFNRSDGEGTIQRNKALCAVQ